MACAVASGAPSGGSVRHVVIAALAVLLLVGCALLRHYESLLVLADVGAGHGLWVANY